MLRTGSVLFCRYSQGLPYDYHFYLTSQGSDEAKGGPEDSLVVQQRHDNKTQTPTN